ncbi:MAG: hypothetical protein Q4D04_01525 [Clostridia bacterium]|nr:hypothetical protein [Clostridia bacterium]
MKINKLGILALLIALCLSLAQASSADGVYDIPEQYDILYVTDIFTLGDAEPGYEDEPQVSQLVVQGCFGTIVSLESDDGPVMDGFDENDVYSLSVSEKCVFLMPTDVEEILDNESVDDIEEWYNSFYKEKAMGEEFYAYYELDDEGELTFLEYVYLP